MKSGRRGQSPEVASDGLSALSVSEHAKDKEFRIRNVIDIFARAMHKQWPERLYYVDPFCGPGKCVIKNSQRETDGSPIIAANVPFTYYYFADENEDFLDALKARLSGMSLPRKLARYYSGSADLTIDEILKQLPSKYESLGLAFLDPWAWDFSFDSLKKLTDGVGWTS